jgi:hypothetical protein
MSRPLRLLALFAGVLAALAGAVVAPQLSGADAESDQADGLRGGIAELAGWVGSLQAEGELGKQLPGLQTTTGDALDLGDAFGTLKSEVSGVSATGVADLATKLGALSGQMGDADIQISTAHVDATGPVVGFDLTLTATRTRTSDEASVGDGGAYRRYFCRLYEKRGTCGAATKSSTFTSRKSWSGLR